MSEMKRCWNPAITSDDVLSSAVLRPFVLSSGVCCLLRDACFYFHTNTVLFKYMFMEDLIVGARHRPPTL